MFSCQAASFPKFGELPRTVVRCNCYAMLPRKINFLQGISGQSVTMSMKMGISGSSSLPLHFFFTPFWNC